MNAHEHAQGADREVMRLATDIQILLDAAHAGVSVTVDDLEHLRAVVGALRHHVACTVRAITHEPRANDRRQLAKVE
jgi:hypothetical protein